MALSRKILILDSEDTFASRCSKVLKRLGHEVTVVTDAGQVDMKGDRTAFDLAVVGDFFQGKTKEELWPLVRRFGGNLPFILITAGTDPDRIISAVNCGASRVCLTPLDEKRFVDAVNETLQQLSEREENIRLKTLLPLYELGQRFLAATSVQAVYDDLVDVVLKIVNVSSVSVMVYDHASGTLKVASQKGLDEKYITDLQIKPGERIAGKVFQSGLPAILNRTNDNKNPFSALMNRKEIAAAISFPIVSKNVVHGVLNVSETKDGMIFSEADIEMLALITDQAMMALENVRFVGEREEHSRVMALLGQYVSPEVSSMLSQRGYDLMEAGSVLDLTVLFADIRQFTLLVQHLSPEQLRQFLNGFFDLFSTIVFSRQGMLDKFMGDGALVIFGAPVKIDEPDNAAVLAGVEIMKGFEKLRSQWQNQYPVFQKIGLGIGISRGPMFLGNVGSPQRLDYTVLGTDVNVAQRLASETESGQVFITDSVFKGLTIPVKFNDMMSLLLRGMVTEVTVHSLCMSSD